MMMMKYKTQTSPHNQLLKNILWLNLFYCDFNNTSFWQEMFSQTVLIQTIQFSISTQFSSI